MVSTGRGGLIDLFPPVPGRSPFPQPARLLAAGLYQGIADAGDPHHVVLSLLGPLGEIINIPMESRDGIVEAVLFECVPGGDLEAVAQTPYADDPKAHDRLVLEKLRRMRRASSSGSTRRRSGSSTRAASSKGRSSRPLVSRTRGSTTGRT